jgi:hypothetical protein
MQHTQDSMAELHEVVGTRPDSDFIIKTQKERAKERDGGPARGLLRLQPSQGEKPWQRKKVLRKREEVRRKREGVQRDLFSLAFDVMMQTGLISGRQSWKTSIQLAICTWISS